MTSLAPGYNTRVWQTDGGREAVAVRGFLLPAAKVRGAALLPATPILNALNKLNININLR